MHTTHKSLAATTMLAPLPVVLISAACTKERLRSFKAADEAEFERLYRESLGNLYESIGEGRGDEIIRTISTIAWTGIVSSTPPRLSVSIKQSRLLYSLVKISGRMMIYPICQSFVKEADLCGIKSGRELDKFERCGFETYQREGDPELPVYADAPLVLTVHVEQSLDLDSHELFICRIDDVLLHEELIDKNGKVHLEKAGLVAYAHGEYYGLGPELGFFGYSAASPKVLRRRMPKTRKF